MLKPEPSLSVPFCPMASGMASAEPLQRNDQIDLTDLCGHFMQ